MLVVGGRGREGREDRAWLRLKYVCMYEILKQKQVEFRPRKRNIVLRKTVCAFEHTLWCESHHRVSHTTA